MEYGDSATHVARFKAALTDEPDDEVIVRGSILHGPSFAIEEAQYFSLKKQVADQFLIDVSRDVFMVGSGKLGFSIAPRKRYQPFGDTSDIDLAIVNHALYERIWHEVHVYKESGAHWPEQAAFERYLSWGWIRPDKLPRSPSFPFTNNWRDFFRDLQSRRVAGPYKVAAALYHDFSFFIKYQQRSVASCRTELEVP